MKYHQLTSQQRSQIFALLQRKTPGKIIASIVGCSESTLSREIRRNSTDKGNYLWDKAHAKAIVTLTERSTNMVLMERLPQGKHPEPLATVVIRLLFPYRETIQSITTDNGSEFCAHKMISKALAPKGTKNPNLVFFADSYSSWQKGAIENANKLIRQYIPKGTDFSTLTDTFIRKIQYKINRRPRKKLNFESPKTVFFRQIANFAVAS
ncbi:MAG: IS30 family transposase [Muribaculaceae bacterium]|nr:IS30 family transposase [Muribaculaceae bacterium]